MIQIFVNTLVCFLVARSGYVSAAGYCSGTAPTPDPTLMATFAVGAMDFSDNLYYALTSGTTNLFYCPLSVQVALAMTSVGAGGSTFVQMNQTLQFGKLNDVTQMEQAFQQYLGSLCSNNTLSAANAIYVQNGFPVNPTFTQALTNYFTSSVNNADFANSASDAASTINAFVAQQTNNNIQNLFSADSFSAATVLVLVNAIYFKGIWATKFDPTTTDTRTFTLTNGTQTQISTMHLTSNFKYYESSALQSEVLQIDYVGDRFVMHVILPKAGVPLATVQKNLNSQNIANYVQNLATQKVELSLPKFKVNFRQELSATLQSLGMVDVFDKVNANLTGIAPSTTQYGNLYVSSVMHQAFVTVNEEGTEAAAATGVVGVGTAVVQEPIEFNVNHPCIYLICDLLFNQIVFMGNLDDPSVLQV